jgi:tRNA (uracil-5-)-methyltransferase
MLSSEKQLDLKRDVIVKAYKTYSCTWISMPTRTILISPCAALPESSIPVIETTVESPLLYNYRTKITPHFERPPKGTKPKDVVPGEQPSWLQIGFNMANNKSTIDIEVCVSKAVEMRDSDFVFALQECPIATPILNETYKSDRQNIIKYVCKLIDSFPT